MKNDIFDDELEKVDGFIISPDDDDLIWIEFFKKGEKN